MLDFKKPAKTKRVLVGFLVCVNVSDLQNII